jgi:hypothetical protein
MEVKVKDASTRIKFVKASNWLHIRGVIYEYLC